MIPPLIRVLIVEDDEEDVILTRDLLQSSEDRRYELDWVRSAPDALIAIQRKAYDVGLVDYGLEQESGLEFIRHCSRLDLSFPLILLTGRGPGDVELEALQAGAADYLCKSEITGPLLERSIRYSLERLRCMVSIQESRQLLASSLDALPSHIAILDEWANILAVNRAWRTFGEENGLRMPNGGVGMNYLDVCAPAVREGNEVAIHVSRGIRDVAENRWSSFHLEYPCDGPSEERWFSVRITRFQDIGAPRIVVAHDLVTDRRLAEESLKRSERRFRALIENSSDAALLTLADGSITYSSPAVFGLLGRSGEEIRGHRVDEFLYPADRESFRQMVRERLKEPGSSPVAPARMRHADGSVRWVAGTVTNLLGDPAVEGVVYNFNSQASFAGLG